MLIAENDKYIQLMIKLSEIPSTPPKEAKKKETKKKKEKLIEKLVELQDKLLAQSDYNLLVILQGLDTAGKSGTIKHVFGELNPSACFVKHFKKPNTEERLHDFLWRAHKNTPPKGLIHIFDRSYYEQVLNPQIREEGKEKDFRQKYKHIKNFEELLFEENNTIVLKFFLHISKEKQKERIEERLKDPTKRWKYSPNDEKANDKYEEHIAAYENVINNTNSPFEWHIIPSDEKWYKKYLVAKILEETLSKLHLKYPKNPDERDRV